MRVQQRSVLGRRDWCAPLQFDPEYEFYYIRRQEVTLPYASGTLSRAVAKTNAENDPERVM